MENDPHFSFLPPFEDDTINGLSFNGLYIPEEIVQIILSYVSPTVLLTLTLVCKKWCNIIKSENIWMHIYNRRHPNKAKKLPWYIFYIYFTTNCFDNMLKNGNGKQRFKNWKIIRNGGHKFRIENPPAGSDPLPPDVSDFRGHTSCFATSYGECRKIQEISLQNKKLLLYIIRKFKPHIYISEWVAGRYDCGCIYVLDVRGHREGQMKKLRMGGISDHSNIPLFHKTKQIAIQQWEGRAWEKVEILIEDYSPDLTSIIFGHMGRDTQFWAGHYGSKMAGGVVKLVFDSIQPLEEKDELETEQNTQNSDASEMEIM